MKKLLLGLVVVFVCVPTIAHAIDLTWKIGSNTYAQTTCNIGEDIILPTAPTKYGYTFNGWRTFIPIEYLESTGTQYIDTEFVPNSLTKVSFVVGVPSLEKVGALFGARNTDASGNLLNSNRHEFTIWVPVYTQSNSSIYTIRFDYSGNGNPDVRYCPVEVTYPAMSTPNGFNITKDREKNYVNGIQIASNPFASFSCEHTAFLFALNQGGNVVYKGTLKVYSTKIWDSDTLVRDFIPVLDENGTPCMYDKVENKFYHNAGTGDFIAGPIIGGE